MTGDAAATPGWLAAEVAEELPGLRLLSAQVAATPGRSPRDVRERLRALSSRVRGDDAIVRRQQPIPRAYRIFYRQVGLDPDATRTPAEQAIVDRLLHGEFRSRSLVDDALTIALVETGVPVWALDAATVHGRLGIRAAAAGEVLGRLGAGPPVPPGRLVVADGAALLAELFGALAPGHGVSAATHSLLLFAVAVPGVPDIHAQEAIWSAADVLAAEGAW